MVRYLIMAAVCLMVLKGMAYEMASLRSRADSACGWGSEGHVIVAHIAEMHLISQNPCAAERGVVGPHQRSRAGRHYCGVP